MIIFTGVIWRRRQKRSSFASKRFCKEVPTGSKWKCWRGCPQSPLQKRLQGRSSISKEKAEVWDSPPQLCCNMLPNQRWTWISNKQVLIWVVYISESLRTNLDLLTTKSGWVGGWEEGRWEGGCSWALSGGISTCPHTIIGGHRLGKCLSTQKSETRRVPENWCIGEIGTLIG